MSPCVSVVKNYYYEYVTVIINGCIMFKKTSQLLNFSLQIADISNDLPFKPATVHQILGEKDEDFNR